MLAVVSFALLAFVCACFGQTDVFEFGNTQGDYMVLQQKPYKSQIWGLSSIYNDSITLTLTNTDTNTIIQTKHTFARDKEQTENATIWRVQLDPIAASFTNYSITAKSQSLNKQIMMKNILFGDVYICSGQSNMVRPVNYVINASQEIQAANDYPFIRIMTVQPTVSDSPLISLLKLELEWSISSNVTVGGGPEFTGNYFSAVCWFFGRDLYQTLNYPLGLIETAYGGTSINSWSSPQVLSSCNISSSSSNLENNEPDIDISNDRITKVANTQLWNAMIYPFLQTTILGAIWYQGEADSGYPTCNDYSCLLISMINDWRLQWSLYSDTSPMFPFGIVQLAAWGETNNNNTCGNDISCTSVAILRYAQTGNYGYLPNPEMINTFFATAVDLGSPNVPNTTTDVHPRYKQQVGRRLCDAALNQIYGNSEVYTFGPIAMNATQIDNGDNILINFRNVGEFGLEIKNYVGFEVFDKNNNNWMYANLSVKSNGNYDIIVQLPLKNMNVNKIRYSWYKAPCNPNTTINDCSVYDQQFQLPAIPFMLDVV